MTQPLVVVGGGEHARVVLEAARSRPERWRLVGFTERAACPETEARFSIPWLGDDEEGIRAHGATAHFILGVGAIRVSPHRQTLAARYDSVQVEWAIVTHASAIISPDAQLAPGVFVAAGAIINGGAALDRHSIVNTGSIIEHDVVVGEYAIVAPGSTIGGGTRIGAGAYLGLGCRLRDHIHVGARSLVGMGAVVVGDIGDDEAVLGVPARPRLGKP